MRRVASLKGRDTEEEIRAEQPWSSKVKALSKRRSAPGVVFLLCMISLLFRMRQEKSKFTYLDVDSVQGGPWRGQSGSTALAHSEEFRIQVTAERLQSSSPSLGWQASSAVRNLDWPRSTT